MEEHVLAVNDGQPGRKHGETWRLCYGEYKEGRTMTAEE